MLKKVKDKINRELFVHHCKRDLNILKKSAKIISPKNTYSFKENEPSLIYPYEDGFILFENAGMFKSGIYDGAVQEYKSEINQDTIFCLSKVNSTFDIQWVKGKAFNAEKPYLSHTSEHMSKKIRHKSRELIAALGPGNNLTLYKSDGEIISSVKLPRDNFAQLFEVPSLKENQTLILVGVTDMAYDDYDYANPWMLFDSDLNLIREFEVKGAGHNVLIDDINKDGENEMLIGYELFDLSGDKIWTLDFWRDKEIDPIQQHADYIDGTWYKEEWIGAIAGSDRLYVFDSTGKTIWQAKLPHPQFCQFGYFNGELRLLVDNQRELTVIYDLLGNVKWKGTLPTNWPYGAPILKKPERPIHLSDPFEKFSFKNEDYLIYKEGGYPYAIDFDGNIIGAFDIKEIPNMCYSNGFHRINDLGATYQSLVIEDKIYLYSRSEIFCFDIEDLFE